MGRNRRRKNSNRKRKRKKGRECKKIREEYGEEDGAE